MTKVRIAPDLVRYTEDKLLDENSLLRATGVNTAPIPVASPEERFPHLHVMLRHRGLPFKEAYSREETRKILGITDKTLGRWVDQGAIKIYNIPSVCASAQDIEDCLVSSRDRTRRIPER